MIPTPNAADPKKPKGMSFGIQNDKKQMLALGDAIKARLELEAAREGNGVVKYDPAHPPPPALSLEGASLNGMAAGFVGLFERLKNREVEGGAPLYRSVRNPVLVIARDAEGVWRGQIESKVGQPASLLKLADSKCLHPSSPSDEAWQYIEPETKDWEKKWQLKCREATDEEVATERARLLSTPVPPVLVLEGGALPGAMAAGFVGVYTRGFQWDYQTRQDKEHVVLHSPCWRHVENPCLWICRGPDGGWVAQVEGSLGTQAGFLRMRDTICMYPCNASAGSMLVHNGKSFVPAPTSFSCREGTADEAAAAKERALAAPPVGLRVSGGIITSDVPSGKVSADGKRTDFSGLYRHESGHVNRSAAFRRVVGPMGEDQSARSGNSLWIVRGRNGCWVGQKDGQLIENAGSLQLPATTCSLPCDPPPPGITWQQFALKQWHDVLEFRCVALIDESEFDKGGAAVTEHEHAHAHGHGHAEANLAHGSGDCCDHGRHGDGCEHDHEGSTHSHDHLRVD